MSHPDSQGVTGMQKRIQWAVAAVLTMISPVVYALGLGSASVDSYPDQPLDVRVEIISRSSDELQSITAGLAAADDFELLGLSRAAISVPLNFEVVTDTAQPHIRITSNPKFDPKVLLELVSQPPVV